MVLLRKIRSLLRRRELEAELAEEIEFHLEMRQQRFEAEGMSKKEARREARRYFGNVSRTREDSRDFWGFRWLDDLAQDVRVAVRLFQRSPGSTLTAILTLALGLGVGVAVFSVVHALLFKPLPYQDPDRLVMLWSVNQREGFDLDRARAESRSMALEEVEDWRNAGIFESVVAFAGWTRTIVDSGEPWPILIFPVSPGFFDMAGVRPALGRGFLPEDEENGARVLVITHEFWKRRFDLAPDVLGERLVLDGPGGNPPETFEIIGVFPEGFSFFSRQADMIAPIGAHRMLSSVRQGRDRRMFKVLGRLRDGITVEQAQARADVFSEGLVAQFPESNQGWQVKLSPIGDDAVGDLKPAMYALLGAVLCVLFIACANVASLFLVRFASRSQEISMRFALGASRLRVLRQLLTESMLIAVSGGLLGFWIAVVIVNHFRELVPAGNTFSKYLVQVDGIAVDSTLAGFAILVTLLSGFFIALIPALRAPRLQLDSRLRETGRSAMRSPRGRRIQDFLVVTEVAAAVVLVAAAGLLVRSLEAMYADGPGIRHDGVVQVTVRRTNASLEEALGEKISDREYSRAWRQARLSDIGAALESLPGVESMAEGRVPMANYYLLEPVSTTEVSVAGEATQVQAFATIGGVGYLETLRIPLLRGRGFRLGDQAARSALVSEKLSVVLWGTTDSVGKTVSIYGTERTVVGVVGDIHPEGVHKPLQPTLILPREGGSNFLLRTRRDLPGFVSEIHTAVRRADPSAYVFRAQPVSEIVLDTIWRVRYALFLLGGLSALAFVLALVGLYSTLSYVVSRRTGEIGLRMALGADPRDVVRLVLGRGLAIAAIGLSAGLLCSAAATRFLASLLYGVTPNDPLTFAGVGAAILMTSLAAAYLPARRASRVSPMTALRHE